MGEKRTVLEELTAGGRACAKGKNGFIFQGEQEAFCGYCSMSQVGGGVGVGRARQRPEFEMWMLF